ncbi:MAG: methyltransferase domain-containing protein [Flavisolibacter sp.]|nr:methyltransferase domain-containing protein [Flavisolibacter sp.]MBD0374246.1 methyltransferase domain-containing protein [Flavisolibacter sp.]
MASYTFTSYSTHPVYLTVFTNDDIARYYDLSEGHYRLFWNLGKARSLHYGYWDATTKSFHEALLRINEVLADWAAIKEGETVLDAGCGVGGSSLWLARERKCHVIGISLNERQVSKANLYARQANVAGQVFFEQKDFTNTSYPDGSFDVVWAIESVCYTDDKARFLREAFRVLKNGGRLVMADFFKKENLQGTEADSVKRWANGWAINDFATIEDFSRQLTETRFRDIEIIDASEAIMPSARRLYRSYLMGIIPAKLYQLFNPKATLLGRNNVNTAYLQYNTLKQGLWTYKLIKAGPCPPKGGT